jgi:AcrR family transcriptional regulator
VPDPTSRRARKKERTRRDILAAAERLSVDRDLQRLRVEAICEEADVARATFFLHFESKSALVAAWEAELLADLELGLSGVGTRAVDRYRAVGNVLWARPGAARCVLFSVLCAQEQSPLIRRVEHELRDLQALGELRRSTSAELATRAWLASAAAILATSEGRRGGDATREELLRLVLSGVAEAKPRLKWSPTQAPGAAPGV